MDREKMMEILSENNMIEILELIDDAERGHLHELELAPSLGLLRDEDLNKAVLDYLTKQGVEIIYVNEDE
ncbi:hypothetical protein ACM26V_01855 [Salipaludibacillus sp. HK11]|uniref:hypothetical protein n=1 Tax=Salipaludibacillus sp. HK11 TaxID=3394320 RepID=UPI0039FDC9AF